MKQRIFHDPLLGGFAILQPDKTLEFFDRKEHKVGATQNWSHVSEVGATQNWSHVSEKEILKGIKGAGFVPYRYIH